MHVQFGAPLQLKGLVRGTGGFATGATANHTLQRRLIHTTDIRRIHIDTRVKHRIRKNRLSPVERVQRPYLIDITRRIDDTDHGLPFSVIAHTVSCHSFPVSPFEGSNSDITVTFSSPFAGVIRIWS